MGLVLATIMLLSSGTARALDAVPYEPSPQVTSSPVIITGYGANN